MVAGRGGGGEREGGAELGGECGQWLDGGTGMLFFVCCVVVRFGWKEEADGFCLVVVVGFRRD